jgi:hypothetical protein
MARYQMRVDPVWRPFVLVGGATKRTSYVEVTPEAVTFHFGYLFNHTEPRAEITAVKKRGWPWWAGIGWRTNMRGTVGMIGSYNGVVEVSFIGDSKAWGLLPLNSIAVSLEDPDGFLTELSQPPAKSADGAARKPARRKSSGNGRSTKRRTRRSSE